MRQPRRNVGDVVVSAGVCDVCPECHSKETTVTINSDTRVYCRCLDCGHIWQTQEGRLTH